jgi:hypothetical protein
MSGRHPMGDRDIYYIEGLLDLSKTRDFAREVASEGNKVVIHHHPKYDAASAIVDCTYYQHENYFRGEKS